MVMKSTDEGATWSGSFVKYEKGTKPGCLTRIKFFGDQGWILGPKKIWKCDQPG